MYMKLELSGWLNLNEENDIGISENKECYPYLVTAVAERVLDYFGCAEFKIGLGNKYLQLIMQMFVFGILMLSVLWKKLYLIFEFVKE